VVEQLAAADQPVRAVARNPDRADLPDGVELAARDLPTPQPSRRTSCAARIALIAESMQLGGASSVPPMSWRTGGRLVPVDELRPVPCRSSLRSVGTSWDAGTYDRSSQPQQEWASDVLARLDTVASDATILDTRYSC